MITVSISKMLNFELWLEDLETRFTSGTAMYDELYETADHETVVTAYRHVPHTTAHLST